MPRDDEKIFFFKSAELPVGLFERIILAIRRESELRQSKRLLLEFALLTLVSLIAVPFSWLILVNQARSSGINYFLSVAFSDWGSFLALWQYFGWAILESLPVAGLVALAVSVSLSLFTIRLFLFKKRLLLGYLLHGFGQPKLT